MTFLAIKTAIASLLQDKTEIRVYAEEVIEGYERPLLDVSCLPKQTVKKGMLWKEKKIEVVIVYYPKNEELAAETLELMDIADKLDSIFDINIAVEDRYLEIFEASWEKGNNVLEYSFNLEFLDSAEPAEPTEDGAAYFGELVLKL